MNEIAETIIMSDGTILFLKALGGVLAGLLVASGHLDANNADAFSQDFITAGGVVLSIISGWVLLEHAYHSAMAELKWNYTPEDVPVKTVTTVTPAQPLVPTKTVTTVTPVTSEAPAQPTA